LFTSRATANGPAAEPSPSGVPFGQPHGRSLGRVYEAAALLLFTGAAFLVLSLATARVDPLDTSVHGGNWVGPAGGSLATLLVQGFGAVAWLLPLEIALCGAPLFRGQRPRALGLRIAGDLVVGIVLAALVQVAAPDALVFGSAPAGGNVGLLFGELMREAFSTLGSFLVALTIVGLILIGRASFSFIAGCQRALELGRALGLRIEALFARLTRAWGQARQLRGERERAARVAAEPRIEVHADEARILLALDDEADWIPMEHTGTPPIAISEALRQGLSAKIDSGAELSPPKFSLDLGEDEASALRPRSMSTPVDTAALLVRFAESSPAAPEVEPPLAVAAAAVASTAPTLEPRIVDTKPASQIEPVVVVKRTPKRGSFQLPSYDLLQSAAVVTSELDRDKILEHATRLEKTLADYGVEAKVEEIHPGPTVTTYEVACEAGTKVSRSRASPTTWRSGCRAKCASSRLSRVKAGLASSCPTTSAWR